MAPDSPIEAPRRRLPAFLRILGLTAAVLILLPVLALVILQFPLPARGAATALIRALPTSRGARVELAGVRGSWITSLALTGLRVTRGDTLLLAADTLAISYSPLELLRRRIVLGRVEIHGGHYALAPPDSSEKKEPSPPRPPASWLTGGFYLGLPIRVGRISVSRSTFVRLDDSTGARAEQIRLEARGLALGGGPAAVTLDTLGARLRPPGPLDRWCTLGARADLSAERLELRSLHLLSDSSTVQGSGTVMLARAPRDTIRDAVFVLDARPLDLADLALFAPGLRAHGRVATHVELRGARVDGLQGTLHAETRRAVVGAIDLRDGTADVRLAGGRVDFDTRVRVQGIPFAAEGWISGPNAAPVGQLAVRIENLPAEIPGLPAWNADAPRHADLDVSIAGGVARTRLAIGTADDQLALSGDFDLRRLSAIHCARGQITRVDGSGGAIAGGTLAFDSVRVTPAAPLTVRAAGLRLREIDLAAWLAQEALASHIDAVADGEFRMGPRPSGRLRLTAAPSTFRGQEIRSGTVDARLERGALELDAAFETAAGNLTLKGTGQPFEREPAYTVTSARFERLDLAPWMANPALASRLTGNATLAAALGDSGIRDLSGTITLEPSTLSGIAIESARLEGRKTETEWNAGARIDVGGEGPLDLEARGSAERFAASGAAPHPALLRLARRDSLTASGRARVAIDLTGPDLRTASGTGSLVASGQIGEARFDSILTRFDARAGVFDVDTLIVKSDAVSAAGSGPLALFDTTGTLSAFRVQGTITRSDALAGLFGVDSLDIIGGQAALEVHGPSRRLDFAAGVGARKVEFPGFRARQIALRLAGILDARLRPDSLQVSGSLGRLEAGGLRLVDTQVTVAGQMDSLAIQIAGGLGPKRRMEAVATLAGDSAQRRLVIPEARMGPVDVPWRLTKPAQIRFGDGWLEVDSFEARSDTGAISIAGRLARRGDLDFSATISSASLRGLTDWTQREDLSGRMDARFRIEGSAAEPRVTGEVSARVQAGSGGGDARARLDWQAGRMNFDASYQPSGSPPVELTAKLPLVLSLAPDAALVTEAEGDVDLHLTGQGVTLTSLSPFFNPKALLPHAGTMDLDVTFAGTSRDVQGRGGIRLADGALDLPGMGVSYSKMAMETRIEGHNVEVERAVLTSGEGTAEMRGSIRFERLSRVLLDLDLTARRFQVIRTRDYLAVVTGNLKLTGTPGAPVATGKMLIDQTEIYLAPASTPGSAVDLSEADLEMLEEHFGDVARPRDPNTSLFAATRLDFDVKLGAAVWIRQRVAPRIAAKLEGGFKLTKEPYGEPLLTGRIWPTPRRGFVEEFARQFDFDEGGEIRLNGGMKEHDIDLKAVYRIEDRDDSGESQVVVRLEVRGRIDKLELILSSEPPMDQSEIINYIVTGKSQSETGESMSAGGMAAQVGLSRVTAGLEDYAQRAVGLDVVQVRQDGLQGTTLIAGRYMSPELYIGFRQPVSGEETGNQTTGTANRTQYELEYSAYQWLTLNLLAETSKFKSFFRARHAY